MAFVVLAFLTGVLCSYPNPNEDKCPGNYTNPLKVQTAIILGKVILWLLHVLLERYIQHHHSKVRSRGYSLLYRSTRHLKSLALLIHSAGKPRGLGAPPWLKETETLHPRGPGQAGAPAPGLLWVPQVDEGAITCCFPRHLGRGLGCKESS